MKLLSETFRMLTSGLRRIFSIHNVFFLLCLGICIYAFTRNSSAFFVGNVFVLDTSLYVSVEDDGYTVNFDHVRKTKNFPGIAVVAFSDTKLDILSSFSFDSYNNCAYLVGDNLILPRFCRAVIYPHNPITNLSLYSEWVDAASVSK